MAPNEEESPSLIDDAISEVGRISFDDPAICTGWVLVSSWMGSGDKDKWTMVLTDNEQPEWMHKGLLHHAIEQLREDNRG